MKSTTSSTFSGVQSVVSGAMSNLRSTVSSGVSSIKSNFNSLSSIASSAYSWGSDICSQMAAGVRAAAGSVVRAAENVASKVRSLLHFSVPDTGPLSDADEYIMRVCPKGATVVVESTVSPGTIDKYVRPVIEANGFKIGEDINLVHAPERIIPGNMVYELLHNNRTIGADDKAIGEKVKKLYSSFCQGEIVVTDIRTAEMTKVVENTFRAVNIAFANELAKICRHDNMDVYEIIKICNMHPRVNILQPGPGVGGHCISVDPWFLVGDYPSLAKVIDESMKTNDGMPDFVLNRIYEIMKEKGLTDVSRVGLYGLTYKENVDDMRESPTLQLLESQERHLATGLKVYDPFITKDVVKNQYHDLDAFLADVDMVVVMVKHTEIRENVDKLAGKVVLDCHNVIDLPGVYHI